MQRIVKVLWERSVLEYDNDPFIKVQVIILEKIHGEVLKQ